MTAREFANACNTFHQFGKIKDIDFTMELRNESIIGDSEVCIREIDFETSTVTLGWFEDSICDCCEGEWNNQVYDLDCLAMLGYLDNLIMKMDMVLDKKGIGF